MKKEPTAEEVNEGTSPCKLRADGSSWVYWERKGQIYCKWIEGSHPEQTPCRMTPEEFGKRYES
jgi:hypothetical protein